MAREATPSRHSRSQASVKQEQAATSATSNKRKLSHHDTAQAKTLEGNKPNQSTKRRKLTPVEESVSRTKAQVPKKLSAKTREKINTTPTAPLDIFVFGEGSCGELGLGSKSISGESITNVMRPRLNTLLSSKDVGVVQIACGGMHAIALTRDNKILTWGGNDHGALGRATNVEEDDDDELNPAESTPGPVDTSTLDPALRWAQVVASDSASFALTDDGRVYGWGTFRVNLTLFESPPENEEFLLTLYSV